MNGDLRRMHHTHLHQCVLPDFVRSASSMIEELEGHLGCFGELWGQFCAVVASIRADMIIHDLVLSRQISFWGYFGNPALGVSGAQRGIYFLNRGAPAC